MNTKAAPDGANNDTEANPFAMAGSDLPEDFEPSESEDAENAAQPANVAPFDRLPVHSLFGAPPLRSPYHTRRAETARQRAEAEVGDYLPGARAALIGAGLKRDHPDYKDVADHNTMTLAYALRYADCGLTVIDSHAIDPKTGEGTGIIEGKRTAKKPRGAGWENRATTDHAELVDVWIGEGEYPPNKKGVVYSYAPVSSPRNVSIVFQPGCYLFALDEDGEEGMEEVRKLEAEHGPLPKTAESISGSGVGRHRIFRCKRPIKNTGSKIAAKVDIRGEGGQIIAAPSVHETGGYYRWKDGCAPWDGIADAPEWLEERAFVASKANGGGKAGTKAKTAKAAPGKRRAHSSERAEGFEGIIANLGDGNGREGFDAPIYRAACSWWGRNPDGDAAELKDCLREAILAAPCDDERAEARYATDDYLDERIAQARAYIEGQRAAEEEVAAEGLRQQDAEDAPLSFHRVLDPLYDEDLVDAGGFLVTPDRAPGIYERYGIKIGEDEAETNRAYKALSYVARDQIAEAMRERFDYVVTGDARAAIRTAAGQDVTFYTEAGLDRLFRNREISYLSGDKVQKLKPATIFMYDRDRVTYSGTCFEPAPDKAADAVDAYNLWTGFAVEPQAGDWSLLRDHLRDVVCGGDLTIFDWVMTFAASPFARPGVKVPSSIAFKGAQGTGKSKFWDWVREAMGCTALKVSQAKHLVGTFNAHLDGKLLVVAEEAFWGGDKQAKGVLKDMISSDTLTIEAKFENAVSRPNYMGVVFISNEDWVIPTDGADARRFLVLDVLDSVKENFSYFAKIDAQMKNGGLEAMVHELTHWDPEAVGLTWADLRNPPKTDSLRQQARMGLSGPMATLVAALEDGAIAGRTPDGDVFYYDLRDDEPTRIARGHINAVLGITRGRGNETVRGRNALEALFGADALNDNKADVPYYGEMRDGSRVDKIAENTRFVSVPPLSDLAETLARYGSGTG